MKAQRYRAVGLAVLSSALVLSGGSVVATTSSSAPASDCTDASLADGDCDLSNNTEECGYDGGDCCECTCVDTTKYVCGVRAGFSCLDPSASCFVNDGDDDASTLPEGDDFTEQTLTPTTTPASNTTSSTEAPSTTPPTEAPSTNITTAVTPTAEPTAEASTNRSACLPDVLSDGICDLENNNEDCGYDAGDCCECTCVSTTGFACGATTTFACADPSAPCFGSDDDGDDDAVVLLPPSDDSTEPTSSPRSTTTSTEDSLTATPAEGTSTATSSCASDSLSDGACDAETNNEECGYDGGDCCECTCVTTSEFTCGDNDNGGYDCIDPNASCNELEVETTGSSAYRTVHTSSPIYLLLAMCSYYVLHLRRLSQ